MTDTLVLCYHAVSPDWAAALSVTPDALERQLSFFAHHGWRGATFHDAVFNPPARRTLAVTFDDAFASVRELAAPILSDLRMPATVFAPTAFISSGERLGWAGVDHWRDGPHGDELTPMGWDDLGSLCERGWEIGSHTRTHPHLSTLDSDTLRLELEESRQECEHALGRPCESIAYPYGDVDDRVAAAARAAGYAAGAALSSRLERLGPHRWPRVGIYHADEWWRFRLKAARPLREARGSKLWRRAG